MKDSRKRKSASRLLWVLFLLWNAPLTQAQNLPVFDWQSHYSYQNIRYIEATNEFIYATTPLVGFFIDQDDQSINLLNKNTGLSDIRISALTTSQNEQILAIGYENGNIDLLIDHTVKNITDILLADNIPEKRINAFVFQGTDLWIGTDFGMVRYDLNSSVILESYQNIGQNGRRVAINDFVLTSDSIYAASDDGILSVSLDDQTNRQDFNFWQRQLTGISFEQIAIDETLAFTTADSDLFEYRSGQWSFKANLTAPIKQLKSLDNDIFLLSENALYLLQDNNLDLLIPSRGKIFESFDLHDGQYFIGTEKNGLLNHVNTNAEPSSILIPGPVSDLNFSSIKNRIGFIWLSEQGISTWQPSKGNWTNAALINSQNNNLITVPTDIEKNEQFLLSSFTEGLFIMEDDSFTPIAELSPDHTLFKENGSFNLQAIARGESNDIWFLQQGISPQLHRWNQPSDTWEAFTLNQSRASQLKDLFILDNGDKWLPVNDAFGGGVIVFNESNNKERYLNINGGQGGLPGSLVNDIVQDQDRFIWVATDEGICFFPSPEEILSNSPLSANIPIFNGGLLLRDEHITQIAIDPANRKWFGTANNGAWLFSESGEELLQHFTASNSPLPDNHILEINIDKLSGVVYFSTQKGLVSFRSDATEGSDTHQNVIAYPNPVPPNFNGRVVIEGLVNNAQLRITDASGKLVRQLIANGSIATWDVHDNNGSRVSSGVYFIFSSNDDGSESYVGKIVVI